MASGHHEFFFLQEDFILSVIAVCVKLKSLVISDNLTTMFKYRGRKRRKTVRNLVERL